MGSGLRPRQPRKRHRRVSTILLLRPWQRFRRRRRQRLRRRRWQRQRRGSHRLLQDRRRAGSRCQGRLMRRMLRTRRTGPFHHLRRRVCPRCRRRRPRTTTTKRCVRLRHRVRPGCRRRRSCRKSCLRRLGWLRRRRRHRLVQRCMVLEGAPTGPTGLAAHGATATGAPCAAGAAVAEHHALAGAPAGAKDSTGDATSCDAGCGGALHGTTSVHGDNHAEQLDSTVPGDLHPRCADVGALGRAGGVDR